MSVVGSSLCLLSCLLIVSLFGGVFSYDILLYISSWLWERPKDNFLWYNLEALLSRKLGDRFGGGVIDDDSEVNSGNDSDVSPFTLILIYKLSYLYAL